MTQKHSLTKHEIDRNQRSLATYVGPFRGSARLRRTRDHCRNFKATRVCHVLIYCLSIIITNSMPSSMQSTLQNMLYITTQAYSVVRPPTIWRGSRHSMFSTLRLKREKPGERRNSRQRKPLFQKVKSSITRAS